MKEEWLMPGAVVPVDIDTTKALVDEIKRLIGVIGGMALQAAAPVQENTMIYRTFEQWKSGNVLEHGVPRTEHYSEDQLDLVEMGWKYGYDAGRAVEQAFDKKAENARELGLDYEPVLKDNSNYRYDPPVAELVAWAWLDDDEWQFATSWSDEPPTYAKPLYTTPPAAQRPFVGLTDEERDDLLDNYITAEGRARAIEAKLREKNT